MGFIHRLLFSFSMNSLPPYNDNRAFYKALINDINSKSNFPMYLNKQGYKLVKKSSGSMEFQNESDKIVLTTSRNPISYFNRNDSTDKGLFFKYIMKRSENFYQAISIGLEHINVTAKESVQITVEKAQKKIPVSLEKNYHIVPIENFRYLTVNRGISKTTVNDGPFQDRLFNTFHIRDNGGRIPNTAFPKFDVDGTIKNYVLYNKPYKSTIDGKIRKFRLVLNQKDHFLFYSNPVPGKHVNIIVGESGMDLLAYHQLHGKKENFYVSFSGNLYREKLEFFVALFKKHTVGKQFQVTSILDNDRQGYEFDLAVFASILNNDNPKVYLEYKVIEGTVSMNFHYSNPEHSNISDDQNLIRIELKKSGVNHTLNSSKVKVLGFLDKLVLEFKIPDLTDKQNNNSSQLDFVKLMHILSDRFLSFSFRLDKSIEKDWNDQLKSKAVEKIMPNKKNKNNNLQNNLL